MKKILLSLAFATILMSLSGRSALAQTPSFPAVWNQKETPDSGERTVDGVWTWDAARKQAIAKWSNGAYAILNVVTDDGKTIVLCRFDPSGSSVGQVADYVGIRNGNTISGKVFWRDPLRDKQRSGIWSATFGPSVDLTGAWSIAASPNTAFGGAFTDRGMFRLEQTAPGNFMVPGGNSRARIRLVGNELQFFNEAGGKGATAEVVQDPLTGTLQRVTWSDGSVWTRIAEVKAHPDLAGAWSIAPSEKTAFGSAFTKPGTFRLEKTAPDTYMIPGGTSRSRIGFVKNELLFFTEVSAQGATGKTEQDGSGTVQRITWSDGSVWTRTR